ncbi:ETX/MTX2 family pore-forming toxin [Lactococcus ileimucosae]|uniref:ETX/MTX2 family pore-forming toxin n=1 Tax=Lactococcus ileimucosae TaxID=2941329 RepID=UPI0020432036|nr:ETX/MTX2 family pore-forming toxin [Lactococcus ileimucosae]
MKKTKVAMGLASLTLLLGSSFAPLKTAHAESSQIMRQAGKTTQSQMGNLKDIHSDVYALLKRLSLGLSAYRVSQGLLDSKYQITKDSPDYCSNPLIFQVTKEPSFYLIPDLKAEDAGDMSTNVTTFDNDSDAAIICSTPSFSYTGTDTTTSTSTMGVNTGIDTTAGISFPGVGDTSIVLSVHFNFSTTKSQTTSTTINWTVPPENISLKPHHKIRVYWILKNRTASGTAAMRARYRAVIPFAYYPFYPPVEGYSLGRLIKDPSLLPENYWSSYTGESRDRWHPVTPDDPDYDPTDFAEGGYYDVSQSTYTAKYGTEMYLRVDDITSGENKAKTIEIIHVPNTTRKVLGQHTD